MVSEATGLEYIEPVKIIDTSATERAGFRKCRRQWFLTVVHRLDPERGNVNFFLGKIYHAGLAGYYESMRLGYSHADSAAEALDAYQDAYDREAGALKAQLHFAWQFAEPDFRAAGDLGMEMLQNYLEREEVNPLFDEVIEVELRLNVPIRSPGGRRVGWLSVQTDVVGRVDGQLVPVDHKTASQSPNRAHVDLDDQLTAEVFAVWLAHGEFPGAVILNVSMKKMVGPPRLLKSGKLSVDKQQATTATLYRRAVADYGLVEADYADILAFLDLREMSGDDPLFVREVSFRTPDQMTAFARDLYYEYRDMRRVAAHPEEAYPNPSPFHCPSCPVRVICTTIQDAGDVAAVTRAGFVVADPRR